VSLRSADPLAAPLIRQNYLSDPADRAQVLKAFKIAMEVAQADAFKPFRNNINLPTHYHNDEQIMAHIRATAECVYHPVGTCRMGHDSDAVTDPDLRVKGVAGLRIADASVMPRIVSGNTNAACIMIGEKAADLVLSAL
jgi:choline dehydrogenase